MFMVSYPFFKWSVFSWASLVLWTLSYDKNIPIKVLKPLHTYIRSKVRDCYLNSFDLMLTFYIIQLSFTSNILAANSFEKSLSFSKNFTNKFYLLKSLKLVKFLRQENFNLLVNLTLVLLKIFWWKVFEHFDFILKHIKIDLKNI